MWRVFSNEQSSSLHRTVLELRACRTVQLLYVVLKDSIGSMPQRRGGVKHELWRMGFNVSYRGLGFNISSVPAEFFPLFFRF